MSYGRERYVAADEGRRAGLMEDEMTDTMKRKRKRKPKPMTPEELDAARRNIPWSPLVARLFATIDASANNIGCGGNLILDWSARVGAALREYDRLIHGYKMIPKFRRKRRSKSQ